MSTLRCSAWVIVIGAAGCWSAAIAPGPELGTPISAADLSAWDINVLPDGTGLPLGQRRRSPGRPIYAAKCAACHGEEVKAEAVQARGR